MVVRNRMTTNGADVEWNGIRIEWEVMVVLMAMRLKAVVI